MTLINNDPELVAHLEMVGMKPGAPVDVTAGIRAETWSSDYAELYVLDVPDPHLPDIQALLDRADAIVAKKLRAQREAGKFLDAHVCIAVSEAILNDDRLVRESDASRFVSRKYWIDRAKPVEEILRRVTLTWINVDQAAASASPVIGDDLSEMRDRIASKMGTAAANEFISMGLA